MLITQDFIHLSENENVQLQNDLNNHTIVIKNRSENMSENFTFLSDIQY